jgi:hypothetical protein
MQTPNIKLLSVPRLYIQMNCNGFGRKRLKSNQGSTQALVCKRWEKRGQNTRIVTQDSRVVAHDQTRTKNLSKQVCKYYRYANPRCYVICVCCLIRIGIFLALLESMWRQHIPYTRQVDLKAELVVAENLPARVCGPRRIAFTSRIPCTLA